MRQAPGQAFANMALNFQNYLGNNAQVVWNSGSQPWQHAGVTGGTSDAGSHPLPFLVSLIWGYGLSIRILSKTKQKPLQAIIMCSYV